MMLPILSFLLLVATICSSMVNAEDLGSQPGVALLVPVTSKGIDERVDIEDTYLFANLLKSLQDTITDSDYQNYRISLYLAVDAGDRIYDQKGAAKLLKKLFAKYIPDVSFKLVRLTGHSQKIASIWNELVHRAHSSKGQNDYYIFLSDDAIVQSKGFVGNIAKKLADNGNFGVVAFSEKHKYAEAGSWPTFPCFHRTHVDIFGAQGQGAFDSVFVNSYVDIWISDVYRAFDSAVIHPGARILNTVGGEDSPRYTPTFPGWDAYIAAVERGRRLVGAYLSGLAPMAERDVIPALKGRFVVPVVVEVDTAGEVEGAEALLRFRWTPRELSYGPEGLHYADYCRQAPGCVL